MHCLSGATIPHRPAYGLYTEQLSGTAFTEPRQNTRRTWLYRIRPSVASPRFQRTDHPTLLTPPITTPVEPNLQYWDPRPAPAAGTDFLSGLWTLGGNGDPGERAGMAVHLYTADTSMTDRVFRNADGELLIVPEQGGLLIHTELGLLTVEPGEVALIPRSMAFRVEILGAARGKDVAGLHRLALAVQRQCPRMDNSPLARWSCWTSGPSTSAENASRKKRYSVDEPPRRSGP